MTFLTMAQQSKTGGPGIKGGTENRMRGFSLTTFFLEMPRLYPDQQWLGRDRKNMSVVQGRKKKKTRE